MHRSARSAERRDAHGGMFTTEENRFVRYAGALPLNAECASRQSLSVTRCSIGTQSSCFRGRSRGRGAEDRAPGGAIHHSLRWTQRHRGQPPPPGLHCDNRVESKRAPVAYELRCHVTVKLSLNWMQTSVDCRKGKFLRHPRNAVAHRQFGVKNDAQRTHSGRRLDNCLSVCDAFIFSA